VIVLPDIATEDWIPQAADFVSQIHGVRLAAAAGIVDDSIVISGRNWENDLHCGEIFKENFDKLGSAGGHRSMAKAVIPISAWKDRFGDGSLAQNKIKQITQRLLLKSMSEFI
jgi:nanoRNase/pAp phosphatase (c-di-AMP/oligoRNAs hydrolase)